MPNEKDVKELHPVVMFGPDRFQGDEGHRAMKILPGDSEEGPQVGDDGMKPHPRYTRPQPEEAVNPALHAVQDDPAKEGGTPSQRQESASSQSEDNGSPEQPAPKSTKKANSSTTRKSSSQDEGSPPNEQERSARDAK